MKNDLRNKKSNSEKDNYPAKICDEKNKECFIMNEQAQAYWNNYWENLGKNAPENVTAEQWGWEGTPMADELADLILAEIKTGSCSAYDEWVHYGIEPMDKIGSYTVVLNRFPQPVGIVKYTNMTILPMNEVTPEMAATEGEGDLSYDYWYNAHVTFFTELMPEIGKEFSPEMLLVYEQFELVDKK